MPQKKNPDVAELTRGKTGRVFGHLQALLTLLKGLPLTYNRDLQEDKEALFDAVDTTQAALVAMTGLVRTMVPQLEQMAGSATASFSTATELADYLAQKGCRSGRRTRWSASSWPSASRPGNRWSS